MSLVEKPIKVLVVGQTPPPYHGQSVMIQMLVDGPIAGVEVHHLRMAFSSSLDQVGRFQIGKAFHLLYLIVAIYWMRFRYRIRVLYYPPTGPNRIPLIRDTLLLISTRWLFHRTVFHFQASGVSELIPRLPSWQQFFIRQAMFKPDAAIQLSELTVADGSFFRAKHIYFVPNAAEDHSPSMSREQATATTTEACRILYVGTVCEEKGILYLLEALEKLRKDSPTIHLDIVGGFQPSDFENVVRARLNALSLNSIVTVHGQKTGNEKWQMFANANIFCFPTFYPSEGFPCVLVEAMSFSLPIVSTHWRGIPSIVDEGKTGFLVQIKNSELLALRIETLCSDRKLRTEMGLQARLRYEREFTRPKHLESLARVFADVVH
jgi:glycosyltransferase involved in cell wall biosynthesis